MRKSYSLLIPSLITQQYWCLHPSGPWRRRTRRNSWSAPLTPLRSSPLRSTMKIARYDFPIQQ